MKYPHPFDLLLSLCLYALAAVTLTLLVVGLVPSLRHRYFKELFPFIARVLHLTWWSGRVFYTWLRRLPPTFTAPALILLIIFFCAYPLVVYSLFELPHIPLTLGGTVSQKAAWAFVSTILRFVVVIVTPVAAVFLAWTWLNLSFLIAGSVYRRWRRRLPRWLREWLDSGAGAPDNAAPSAAHLDPEISAELEKFERIGIILAGGGAKGAYQAGALRAIHQFLTRYGALHKVRMIAGTSIGSWNALFWLAGLIGGEEEDDLLGRWWRNIHLAGLIEPAKYAPGQNFFLSNQPWQDQFDALFLDGPFRERIERHLRAPAGGPGVHFYFTRTNVGMARLEFTTNRQDLDRMKADVLARPDDKPGRRRWGVASEVEDVRFAVFSSMTLPPLFQYMTTAADGDPESTQYYEDGGVIDNLPVVFGTEVEGCDLLFVLPLNASFEGRVDDRWMLKRLARVINIRQGVLEQKALTELQRRNKLTAGGTRRPVSVFAVCPEDDALISTAQFWNRGGAARALNLMYEATSEALREKFVETVRKDRVSVLLVDGEGRVRPREV